MFGIGRRFFYHKILKNAGGANKPEEPGKTEQRLREEAFIKSELLKAERRAESKKTIGRKTLWYSRVAALFMVAVLVAQMFSFAPGMFAGRLPRMDDLWMFPEIEYKDKTIYDGMTIPIGAEMNAKFEFLIDESAFPIEVFLPDVLRAEADLYLAAAFDIYGAYYPGAKVIVNEKDEIWVHFDAPKQKDEDGANNDGREGSGNSADGYECDESCDHDAGSNDNETAVSGTSGQVSFGENDENPDPASSENSSTGSVEPTSGNVNSGSENSSSNDTPISNSEPVENSSSSSSVTPTDADSNTEACNDEDGMSAGSSSASIFSGIGSATASANEGDSSSAPKDPLSSKYWIKFELPVFFDEDELPPQPDPEWDAYFEALDAMEEGDEEPELHIDPWLVDILNTEYDKNIGKHVAEFVEIVIEPEALEYEAAEAFGFEIYSETQLYRYIELGGQTPFTATVNWNDNKEDAETRPSHLPADGRYLQLQLYFIVDGMAARQPVTAALLIQWGAAANVTAANNILRVTPSRTGTTNNFWAYNFTLPAQLVAAEETVPGTWVPSGEPLNVTYSFALFDDDPLFNDPTNPKTLGLSIAEDYIIESRVEDPTLAVNTIRCTLKEVFVFYIEWKDGDLAANPGRYNTRPTISSLRSQLNITQLEGAAVEGGTARGSLSDGSSRGLNFPKDLDISVVPSFLPGTLPSDSSDRVLKTTILGMPAFNAAGQPFNYFITETGNQLAINQTTTNLQDTVRTPNATVKYEALYENVGNFSEEHRRTHNGGTLVNRLVGDAIFEATKTWLDDNAPPSTRPNNGRFLLNRYPDIVGRSYRNASPVQGAELFMGVPQNTFDIIFGDFSLTGAAGPLPRFDIDGQEYVYFVQELYDADPPTGITLVRGPGEYIGTAKYDEFPSATPIPRGVFVQGEGWYPSWWEFSIIKNKIYNGGELENLRVGSVDLSVTKKWVAAARQSMDSSVTVYVERRLVPRVGPPSHADNVPWPAVPKDLLNSPVDADDGEYTLSGFRAEVQEKTHDFAGLDKYDKNGVLYQYRVTESKINMSPPAVEAEIKSTQDFVILDGFRYQLRRDPIAGNLNDILLTNTLKGETEIRVRKLWNGGTLKDDITFQIRRIGGGGGLVNFSDVTLYWEDPVSRARTDEDVPSSFMIPGSYTWKRNTIVNTGDRFAGAEEPGKWLVITGLDRFDDKGREIEYRVEETSSHTNYHHSFNFAYSFRRYGVAPRTEEITDPQSPRYYERIGTVDASFINTPSSGVGRYVNVNKVWADDGDQNCRGSVTFGLYYRPGGAGGSAIWERVGGTTIYSTNDWMGYIHLPTTAPHDTAPYTDYIVVEESVAGATVGYTAPTDSTTGGTLSAIPQLAGYGLNGAYGVQLGQVRTSAHYYNVFATYRADTATTRPSYTFKNVRTGTVEINIEKKFNDANHHQSRVQRVQIDIQRRLNYTNESAFRTLTSADGFDGVVILQYPTLTYSSPTGASALPKYDEDGMLYHYRVIERYVDDMAIFSSGPDGYVGRHGSDSATYSGLGSYTLGDGHRYAVSIGFDPVWGDHTDVTTNPDVTPNTVPRPDYYKFTVTNQREDTIKGLTVHKLWHDVERSTENGRNPIEARQRPDINFRLWQNVGNDDPAGAVRYAGDGFAEHIWNTNRDSRNEYYWSCTFTDLPRYTSEGVNAGTEIFYFVDEPALPATSEYKTYYWNTVAANRTPVDAPTWIWSPTDLPNITDIKIHDVPSNATDLVSPGGAKLDKVRNNGIIVNRREADRDMHGRKIWENVPGGLSANAYPTITLTLMQQNKEHRRDNTPPNNALPANVDVNVPVPNINKPSLLNRATDFRFLFLDGPLAETEAKVDKYDDYGIYKKYRAYEVSQANGYFAPIYNDFTLDVTNRYNLNGPVITAEFTKVWDFGPYGSEPPNGLEPTANVELWRVMTDSGGNDIAATRARVRTASVTWTEDDPEQKVEFAEGTGLTRLLRYGFNGFPYRYFLIENMDGYTFEHENVASPDVDPGGLDPYHYEFEAENIYDGKTDGQNHLVLLHGHKDWVGDTYGPTGEYNFGTRPDNVSLRVFRAVMVGTTLSAFEEITSFVRIDWIDNGNQWTYTVNADNEKVGDESITDGQPSLHRYAVTSDPYIYYVEEVYPATNSGSPVAENHHYTADIADGSGNGTKITTGTAAGTGATSIAAGSVRVQVAEDSGNFIANFKNTLKTVEPEVIKAWQKKSGPDGTPVPMATSPSRDFELMLPSEITFKVQSRPAGAATWTDLMYSGTTTLVTKTFTRAELLAGLTGTATQSTLKLDIHLPENADLAGVIKREYRMIETHIGGDTDDHRVTGTFETLNAPSGNFPVTAYTGRDGGGLGGFTVTYTENGRVVNTIETMPIFIQKVWVDDNNRDGLRPGSTVGGVHIPGNMSFSIVRDGVVAQVKTVSLTPTLQESGTTFDVPAYQAGSAELSTYAVQELTGTAAGEANARTYYTMTADPSVPGANVISNIITVSPPATKNFALGDPDPTTKSATSTPNVPATTKSFIFVNSHDKIRFNLTVTKIWDDDGISNIGDDNENDITPTHIHLALQRRIEGTSWVNIPDASSPGTDQLDAIIVSDVNTNLAAVRIDRPSGGWAASTTHTWSNIIARHDAGARYFFQVVEVNCNCPDDNTLKAYKPHVTVTPVDGSITVSGTSGQYVNNLSRHVVMDVRMSNKLETTSLAVTKQWFNADGTPMGATQNPFAKMEEVEVQLLYRLANTTNPNPWLPVTGNTETLNAPGWTATFDNLPLENNKGVKYEYSVREIRIGTQSIAPDDKTPYYSWSRAVEDTKGLGTEEQSVVVKNTLLTRGDIFVYIVWEDFRNQDGLRPEDVNVGLIMDMDLGTNAKYDEKDIKFTGDGWAGKFESLPMYRPDGSLSRYQIVEQDDNLPITNYEEPDYQVIMKADNPAAGSYTNTPGTGTYAGGRPVSPVIPYNAGGTGGAIGDPADPAVEYAVYIRNKRTPTVMSIGVTKNWDPGDNTFNTRPASIFLQLYDSIDGTTWREVGDRKELFGSTGSWTTNPFWDNLPVSRNDDGRMYNYGGSPPGVQEVTIGGQIEGESKQVLYKVAEYSASTGETTVIGHDLVEIIYSSNNQSPLPSMRGIPNDPIGTHSATINNKRQTVTVTVEKKWLDGAVDILNAPEWPNPGSYPFAKIPSVFVQLEYRLASTINPNPNAWLPVSTTVPQEIKANSDPSLNWKTSFTNLPRVNSAGVVYEYRVVETQVGDVTIVAGRSPFSFSYNSSVSSTGTNEQTVTLTNTLQKRSNITVTKEWEDSNNQDGIRPTAVVIHLVRFEEATEVLMSGPVTLNSANNWTHTFTNLPKFNEDGITESIYRIREVVISDYELPEFRVTDGTTTRATSLIAGTPSRWQSQEIDNMPQTPSGATLVELANKYTPKVMGVSVNKVWDDQTGLFNSRPLAPAGVQLTLQSTATPNNPASWENVPVSTELPTPSGFVAENPRTITGPATTTWTTSAAWSGLPIMRNGSPVYYRVVEVTINGYREPVYNFVSVSDSTGELNPGGLYTRGSLENTTGTIRTGTVTNVLHTVDVIAKKVWGDHYNEYAMRPTGLTFTLQRRLQGTADDFANVTFTGFQTRIMTSEASAREQEVKFENLPMRDLATGALWEYRVLETGVSGTSLAFTPDPTDPTKGVIGNPPSTHYKFSSSTTRDAASGNYTTTVTNELEVERITIRGTKRWHDEISGIGEIGTRPRQFNLQLRLWYWGQATPGIGGFAWREITDPDDFTIVWKPGGDAYEWDYEITGFGLSKYVPGLTPTAANLRIYAVQEVLPASGLYKLNEVDDLGPLTRTDHLGTTVTKTSLPNSTFGIQDSNGDINTYFSNDLIGGTTEIWASKTIDWGQQTDFRFKIYFSDSPITDANQGSLYVNHNYEVYNWTPPSEGALPPSGIIAVSTGTISSTGPDRGIITIKSGQSFVLKGIPKGLYFSIEEEEHDEYVVSPVSAVEMRRQIDKGDEGVDTQTLVEIKNLANREISIINETPNEGQNRGIPGRLTNAGGMVTVETPQTLNPDVWDSDEEVENALAVLWKPDTDRFWVYGNEITIEWVDFGSNVLNSVTIRNYLNPDGSLKELADCDIDNPSFLPRFYNAKLSMRNGAVRLELCVDLERMPRTVAVYVLFLPTIAVNNVTEGNVGGRVRVECTQSGGNLNNNADGVPALNAGRPYVGTTKVYGLPDPGYRVDWDYIVLRNLNDLDGPYELAQLDANGYFTIHLDTWIAGFPEVVEKNGRATEGSIMVEILHNLPVPLQIDLRFIPDTGAGSGDGSGVLSNRTGGLPRTGVESVLSTLVIGLVMSITAGAAVLIVIRRISAKEKKG